MQFQAKSPELDNL